MGDLHLHTIFSDGTDLPEKIIRLARRHVGSRGVISMVDHNTFTFTETSKAEGLTIIPGIELSATEAGHNVHLVAYFSRVQVTHELKNFLESIQKGYLDRARRIRQKIVRHGYKMPPIRAIQSKLPLGIIYTYHLKRAFHDYNGGALLDKAETEGLFYVPENFLPTIGQAVKMMHAHNGIVLWAHPGTRFLQSKNDLTAYEECLEMLLFYAIEGIEVYHPEHSIWQKKLLARDSLKYNLLVGGGSDYHGYHGQVKHPMPILGYKEAQAILKKLSISPV